MDDDYSHIIDIPRLIVDKITDAWPLKLNSYASVQTFAGNSLHQGVCR
jgi:hypothetical protein